MNVCSEMEVIPQISGTCWFNGILMALLYSKGAKKITNKLVSEWSSKDIKEDKLKKFFNYINKYNYSNPDKIKSLFKRRVKTEFLLLSYLTNLKEDNVYKMIKHNLKKSIYKLGNYIHYVIDILNYLNYKYIDFYYKDQKIYGNIYNKNLRIDQNNEHPEIIVLVHYDLYDFYLNDTYLEKVEYKLNKESYDEIISGIENYQEIITINGIRYKLDSCLICNYNYNYDEAGCHAIVGLSCFDNSYVYNGWNIMSENTNNYNKLLKKSCGLIKHDWKSALYSNSDDNSFCINKSLCNLKEINEKELCFNFSKGHRILIYVIDDDINVPTLDKLKSQSLKSSSLSFKSKSLSPLIEEFYELENRPIYELKKILINDIKYNSNIIDTITARTIKTKLKLLYIDFFNKLPEDYEGSESILKQFLLYLIKKYIKDDIKYNINDLYYSTSDINLFIYLLPIYEETIIRYYIVLNNNDTSLKYEELDDSELSELIYKYYPNGYDSKILLIYNIIKLLNKDI